MRNHCPDPLVLRAGVSSRVRLIGPGNAFVFSPPWRGWRKPGLPVRCPKFSLSHREWRPREEEPRPSGAASSKSVANFRTFGLGWSATRRHWVMACSASSWAKVGAMRAETTRRLPARSTRAWSNSRRWLLASREYHRDNASQMAGEPSVSVANMASRAHPGNCAGPPQVRPSNPNSRLSRPPLFLT